jgi:hypothetical protein
MANRTIRTLQNRTTFLDVLQASGNITRTAESLGVGRSALYDWRDDDPEFAAAWDHAIKRGLDGLEDVAIERARQGSARPADRGRCGRIRCRRRREQRLVSANLLIQAAFYTPT